MVPETLVTDPKVEVSTLSPPKSAQPSSKASSLLPKSTDASTISVVVGIATADSILEAITLEGVGAVEDGGRVTVRVISSTGSVVSSSTYSGKVVISASNFSTPGSNRRSRVIQMSSTTSIEMMILVMVEFLCWAFSRARASGESWT